MRSQSRTRLISPAASKKEERYVNFVNRIFSSSSTLLAKLTIDAISLYVGVIPFEVKHSSGSLMRQVIIDRRPYIVHELE